MKSYTKYLWFNTKNRYEIVNITDEVQGAIDEQGQGRDMPCQCDAYNCERLHK